MTLKSADLFNKMNVLLSNHGEEIV